MVPAVVAVEVEGKSFDQAVREFENHLIALALTRAGGQKAAAARALGISHERLSVRLARSPIRIRAVIE